MKNLIYFSLFVFAVIFSINGCSEDSNVTQTNPVTNRVPDKPKNPSPVDSAEGINPNVVMVLAWQCSDPDVGDTVKYDVYISNSLPVGNTPIVTGLTNPSYGLGIVAPNTSYFWKVVATDNHGGSSTGNTWRFKTGSR